MKTLAFTSTVLLLALHSFALPLQNGDFEVPEQPDLTGFNYSYYSGSVAGWNWGGGSGITELPSAWASYFAVSPGDQVAFLQNASALISQEFTGAGNFVLDFLYAGRPDFGGYGGNYSFNVLIDGNVIGSLSTVDGQYFGPAQYQFYVPAGLHTLGFQGASIIQGNDESAFIDKVTLTAVPDSGASVVLVMLGLAGIAGFRKVS